ncbi:MAG: hypothetical protein J5I90_10545 [Caldilineales bacterium]|nr:hypothetical protein [Caldilineales bacterium]
MDLFRRLPLAFFVALTLLLITPALAGLLAPVLVQAPLVMPAAIDQALVDLGVQEDAYAFLAELGLYPPGTACASGGCQAWYCDIMMNGSCYQRNGDGSYSPTSPVGCSGNCGGGGGSCSRGTCGNGERYNCCAQAGRGGCGPILRGVRGQDCCGGPPKAEPTVAPTPTPPPCDGERIDLIKPGGSYTQDPPHAVVVGQDPAVRGFDLDINLRGGRAEWWKMESKQVCDPGGGAYPADCANGPWQWRCVWTLQERHNDPIVKVEVAMRLHESTVAWIKELAARYPGARQTEPLPQVFTVWEGRAMAVHEDWNYLPSDPGVHGGRIIITTAGTPISDPQEVSIPFEVKVHLKDSTLWEVE